MNRSTVSGLQRIALIGNSPPRLCGIATFTRDLRNGLVAAFPGLAVDIYAMNDRGNRYDYPAEVSCSIDQDAIADYQRAAHRINESRADVVCVQHEYGIFGGTAGVHLLRLLDRVHAPVVVTLHTVLENPSPEQRAVIEALVRRATKLVVMAEKGKRMLMEVHGVAEERIGVVFHGVADRPFTGGADLKRRFDFEGRRVLLTFGLLSPNKGIETMIRALPGIAARHPDVLYVVLGATHPHLVAQQGEVYRESLVALGEELGVSEHLRFIDGFLEQDRLLDYLTAADIYVTPYLNEAQITSGTLSQAVAIGKPVVSTPYWHAVELLADGVGILVPFGDSARFAREICTSLDDDAALQAMRRKAWSAGRAMIWPATAAGYVALFEEALGSQPARLFRGGARDPNLLVAPKLNAVERLTDNCGIVQHAIFAVPDRSHGYCVDDNCRALMLMHRQQGDGALRASELATVYAAFVQHAWNGDTGRFRNFMAFDRSWLESVGSEDSFGRSLWSLGDTVLRAHRHELRRWALHLFDQVAPHVRTLGSPRTHAFAILAADAILEAHPGHEIATALIRDFGARLHERLKVTRRNGWTWFESVLAYDNARLPQGLLRAARRLNDVTMRDDALAALDWLHGVQTNADGQFRAVGTDSFGREYATPLPYDQQPLEAWATIDAGIDALRITGEARWRKMADAAYGWYLGANDIGLPLGSGIDGGCFDGLMSDRANLNQGAESVLAFQFACCAMRDLVEKGGVNGSAIGADAVAS